MKTDIHPEYIETNVRCSCGNTFTTRSTKPDLHVELCNECHPFYTGKQKLVDTGGRVERFERRYGRRGKKKGRPRGSAGEHQQRGQDPRAGPPAAAPATGGHERSATDGAERAMSMD